jgi:voltage-gated potassium channel
MDQDVPSRWSGRWLARRVERKGLKPRYAAYLVIVFWAVATAIFGLVERLVDPKSFDSIWLGIWWAVQTVTTVGYGDIVPGSTVGKAIATVLMLGGLSLLAVVTATITSGFVARQQARDRAEGHDPVMRKLDEVGTQLDALKADLERLQRRSGPANPG